MRVLRVSTFLDFGGIESKMVKLSAIDQDEFSFIFCALGKGGAAASAISMNGKEVVCLNSNLNA